MLRVLLSRFRQKYRTMPFPSPRTMPPDRFRGRPVCDFSSCNNSCAHCAAACPSAALSRTDGKMHLDMGRCIFCGACAAACPEKRITFTTDYRLAAARRDDLVVDETRTSPPNARALRDEIPRLLGRSLKLREVSAGGCNACEADTNVLATPGFDLGRFGIQFVASPRHADGMFVTGPVSANMLLAVRKTWDAIPEPKIAVAAGTCAISGGLFAGHDECSGGLEGIVPIDLYIPGCPPHPLTILDGLLRLIRHRAMGKSG